MSAVCCVLLAVPRADALADAVFRVPMSCSSVFTGFIMSLLGTILLITGSHTAFAVLYSVGVLISLTGTGFLIGVRTPLCCPIPPFLFRFTLSLHYTFFPSLPFRLLPFSAPPPLHSLCTTRLGLLTVHVAVASVRA